MQDNVIAGLMAGNRDGDTLDVTLDYATPRYRDYRLGAYFFIQHPEFFRSRGIKKIYAHARDDTYRQYLQKMGFTPVDDKAATWTKNLS